MPLKNKKVRENKACDVKKEALVNVLKSIPSEAWTAVIRLEPEWPIIETLLKKGDFGKISVFLMMKALNAFQVKGKAEDNYWRDVERIVNGLDIPDSPSELIPLLESFYKTERIPTAKIKRLHRFLESPLAETLWRSTPEECAQDFQKIWERLAVTMKQNKCAKTICFAMKFLGMALLGVGESGFEFSGIPIPVDSRIIKFSCAMGICESEDERQIRDAWDAILSALLSCNSQVDMIKLDSLIWQIGGLDPQGIHLYFKALGIAEVGPAFTRLLD